MDSSTLHSQTSHHLTGISSHLISQDEFDLEVFLVEGDHEEEDKIRLQTETGVFGDHSTDGKDVKCFKLLDKQPHHNKMKSRIQAKKKKTILLWSVGFVIAACVTAAIVKVFAVKRASKSDDIYDVLIIGGKCIITHIIPYPQSK